MKQFAYQAPELFQVTSFVSIALAQYAEEVVPSNPVFTCDGIETDCFTTKFDTFDMKLTWNDNAGSDVSGYVVSVSVSPDGGNYNLTSLSIGCSIAEISSGVYQMECENITMTGSGCNCGSLVTVNSITDGDGNVLNSSESCNTDPGGC